jgi:hypothetical protein
MNTLTDLITEALRLLPSIKNANSKDYPRLVAIYSEINRVPVNCSPCIYYSVVGYFEALGNNSTYQSKTMASTKYKVLPDQKGNQRTAFMFNGSTYPVEVLTDATIEKMVQSGSFKLGTHFAIVDEIEAGENEAFTVLGGDADLEVQEPIVAEEVVTPKVKGRGRRK